MMALMATMDCFIKAKAYITIYELIHFIASIYMLQYNVPITVDCHKKHGPPPKGGLSLYSRVAAGAILQQYLIRNALLHPF